jgi:hypothetical protein
MLIKKRLYRKEKKQKKERKDQETNYIKIEIDPNN